MGLSNWTNDKNSFLLRLKPAEKSYFFMNSFLELHVYKISIYFLSIFCSKDWKKISKMNAFVQITVKNEQPLTKRRRKRRRRMFSRYCCSEYFSSHKLLHYCFVCLFYKKFRLPETSSTEIWLCILPVYAHTHYNRIVNTHNWRCLLSLVRINSLNRFFSTHPTKDRTNAQEKQKQNERLKSEKRKQNEYQ